MIQITRTVRASEGVLLSVSLENLDKRMNKRWLLNIASATVLAQLLGCKWLPNSTAYAENAAHVRQLLSTRNCPGCDLSGVSLEDIDLSGANLKGADLSNAVLRHTQLIRADLEGADLSGARLLGIDLTGANLRAANLSHLRSFFLCNEPLRDIGDGKDCIHQVLLFRLGLRPLCDGQYGADVFQWPEICDERYLSSGLVSFERFRASPSGVYHGELNFFLFNNAHYINMQGVNLSRAELTGAQLSGADLRYADLSEASAAEADFDYALMLHADVDGLRSANLSNSWTTAEAAGQWLQNFTAAEIRKRRERENR